MPRYLTLKPGTELTWQDGEAGLEIVVRRLHSSRPCKPKHGTTAIIRQKKNSAHCELVVYDPDEGERSYEQCVRGESKTVESRNEPVDRGGVND